MIKQKAISTIREGSGYGKNEDKKVR